jgi:hypothetical protein
MSDAPHLIEATSGPSKTLADDTLRIPLTVGATHAQAAFALFKSRGTAMALALLEDGAEATPAASAGVQVMGKGALRLFADIEPRHAGEAFRRFGDPGTPLALAALKPDHVREREQRQPAAMTPTRLAVQWCADERFRRWLAGAYTVEWSGAADAQDATVRAAEVLRLVCGIETRRELDTDVAARARFDNYMRRPFAAWLQQQPGEAP